MLRSKLGYIAPPLLSIFLLGFGIGFFLTYLSVRLDQDGFSDFSIGVLLSVYFLGQLIGAFCVEPLFRYVGHIRAFATTASLSGMTILVMALTDSFPAWGVMRFIAGFCIAVQYVVVESWLLAIGDKLSRGRVLAVYMIALYLSLAFSQLLIDMVVIESTEAFLISSLFVVSGVLPICFSAYESPRVPDVETFAIKKILFESPFGLAGAFMSGMTVACIYGFTPVYAITYEMPVSWVMFSAITGGILLQWPIGKLSDVFNRRAVLTTISGLLVIPSLLLCFFPGSLELVLILSFFIGGIAFTIYPLSITEVSDRFDPEHVTRIATVLLIFYELGCVVGPLIGSVFSYPYGIIGIYMFIAVNGAILCLFGLARSVWTSPVPIEEQGEFVTLPRVTPVAYELDPRAEET